MHMFVSKIVCNSRHIPVSVDNLAHGLWITLLVSAYSLSIQKSRGGRSREERSQER